MVSEIGFCAELVGIVYTPGTNLAFQNDIKGSNVNSGANLETYTASYLAYFDKIEFRGWPWDDFSAFPQLWVDERKVSRRSRYCNSMNMFYMLSNTICMRIRRSVYYKTLPF